MKTLAIYFSDPNIMGYPFRQGVDKYLPSYQALFDSLSKKGIQVFIVRGDSYLGDGFFESASVLKAFQEIDLKKKIKADLIWNRDHLNTISEIRDCRVLNNPDFDNLCVDKFETAKCFPSYSPRTEKVHTYEDCIKALASWPINKDELIVLKKDFSVEGRGVHILPLSEIHETLYKDWSHILIQEYLDTTIGIPGIAKGAHDLRVVLIDGQIMSVVLRTPPKGSLISNTARGASLAILDPTELPEEAHKLVLSIHQELARYSPDMYSIDMGNTSNGFKLIELNSHPAMQNPNNSERAKHYFDSTVQMLTNKLLND